MACKVLIPQDVAQPGKDYLRARGHEIKMGSGVTADAIAADVVDCDAILARTAPFPAKVFEAGKKLKVISRHGVGYDNIDVAKATELGIWVTFAPESNADTVAEHAIGCIFTLARNFLQLDRETRAGNWGIRDKLLGFDLSGKVLGIVGLGKIGRRVAQKASRGLDMKVVGYDPFLELEQIGEFATPVTSMEEVFGAADFVSVHIPGGAATKGIINKKLFAVMKKTAFFINASRGDVVAESDLIEALRNGTIAGAAIDVYEKEPPPKDNPLMNMGNVLLTPHNASQTRECMIRMALHAAQGIDEVLSGKRPTWPVNDPAKRR
ncbi:MAG: hydroxyacid dehydrogenase [Desulfobacterales bacterium]|jgi:D-3-phosphoglycerate dehydrogenase|nr:hydroxyacid dehydrogenase [Desulfobacterales bacterium]